MSLTVALRIEIIRIAVALACRIKLVDRAACAIPSCSAWLVLLHFAGLLRCISLVYSAAFRWFAALHFAGLQHCVSLVYSAAFRWFAALQFAVLQRCAPGV